MALVYPSTHPLVRSKLARLRAKSTKPPEFRALVRSLATLIAIEATTDLPMAATEVETPLGNAGAEMIAGPVGVVPILRAGLGMAEGVLDLIPEAEVWHVGMYRDETTLKPVDYYNRLTNKVRMTVALVVDPMLATGGSAVRACEILREAGVTRIKYLALIAAPEGIAHLSGLCPDVPIHVGVIDSHLTEIGFIYPGLGDAGDRQFATS